MLMLAWIFVVRVVMLVRPGAVPAQVGSQPSGGP